MTDLQKKIADLFPAYLEPVDELIPLYWRELLDRLP